MSLRKFVGKVSIDHKEKTLDLDVIPRDERQKNSVSSTRSLSGGERSFATVSFLIALWDSVDHPFFILDEYDVFTVSITSTSQLFQFMKIKFLPLNSLKRMR